MGGIFIGEMHHHGGWALIFLVEFNLILLRGLLSVTPLMAIIGLLHPMQKMGCIDSGIGPLHAADFAHGSRYLAVTPPSAFMKLRRRFIA